MFMVVLWWLTESRDLQVTTFGLLSPALFGHLMSLSTLTNGLGDSYTCSHRQLTWANKFLCDFLLLRRHFGYELC